MGIGKNWSSVTVKTCDTFIQSYVSYCSAVQNSICWLCLTFMSIGEWILLLIQAQVSHQPKCWAGYINSNYIWNNSVQISVPVYVTGWDKYETSWHVDWSVFCLVIHTTQPFNKTYSTKWLWLKYIHIQLAVGLHSRIVDNRISHFVQSIILAGMESFPVTVVLIYSYWSVLSVQGWAQGGVKGWAKGGQRLGQSHLVTQ